VARRLGVVVALVALASAAGTASSAALTPREAAAAGLVLTVTLDGAPADSAPGPEVASGAALAWSYDVTNSGATRLWALYVWHDGPGRADCPVRSLAPGETVRCTAVGTATAGAHADRVQAWAWDEAGAQVGVEATAYYTGDAPVVVPAPALDLEALVAGKDADIAPGPVLEPGKLATFRYVVVNTGNVTLWGLWVWDPGRGAVTCPTRTLAPGAEVVCILRQAAVPGWSAATVQARATDEAGTEAADTDAIHYYGAARLPGVALEALVEGFDEDLPPGPRVGAPGQTISFTYLVTNTGGLALSQLSVRDPGRAVTCPARRLAPGAVMTCTATTVAELGEFSSVARVAGRAGGTPVSATDPIYYHVRPEPRINHLDLEVTVNGREADTPAGPSLPVGRLAHFVYLITYTGNNVVYNVTIQDPFVPESLLSCDGDRQMSLGETLRCTAEVPVTAGPYASSVTVASWDADGRRVEAADLVHYYGMP
jgi:hypothetical protein